MKQIIETVHVDINYQNGVKHPLDPREIIEDLTFSDSVSYDSGYESVEVMRRELKRRFGRSQYNEINDIPNGVRIKDLRLKSYGFQTHQNITLK